MTLLADIGGSDIEDFVKRSMRFLLSDPWRESLTCLVEEKEALLLLPFAKFYMVSKFLF